MTDEVNEQLDIELVERTMELYKTEGYLEEKLGELAPRVTNMACGVCIHPQRFYIENCVYQGYTCSSIVARLDNPASLGYYQIRDHVHNGHAPISKQAYIEAMWARAEADGVSPEEYTANQRTEVEALNMVVDKFHHRLRDPEFAPDIREGLAAIKLLDELGASATNAIDANDLFVALNIFMSHVRTILVRYAPTEINDALEDFRKLLTTDPVLRVMADRMDPEVEEAAMLDRPDDNEEDEILEAEIIVPNRAPPEFIPMPPVIESLDTRDDSDDGEDFV